MSKEITSRQEDYAQWYNDLVIKGEPGRLFGRQGLYGHQTLWICTYGKKCGISWTRCLRIPVM